MKGGGRGRGGWAGEERLLQRNPRAPRHKGERQPRSFVHQWKLLSKTWRERGGREERREGRCGPCSFERQVKKPGLFLEAKAISEEF